MSLLPTLVIGLNEIQDGDIQLAPVFCKKMMRDKSSNKKCDEFHKKYSEINGLHICPYGFGIYTAIKIQRTFIYIGLIIKGEMDYKKIKMKIDLSEAMTFSLKELERIVDTDYKSFLYEEEANNQKRFLKTSLHNMKKLSQIAEYSLKTILDRTEFSEILRKQIMKPYYSTMLVNANYEVFDYSVNIESIQSGKAINAELWGKFYAMQQTLEYVANIKKIRFENPTFGIPKTYVHVHNSFRLLPFLIYENAVKYSPEQSKIVTLFELKGDKVTIKIKNRGYIYNEKQLESMFAKFYRVAENKTEETGSGVGLYLAKEICNLDNIEISLASYIDNDNSHQKINGIFEVTIELTIKTK